jgi:predicted DNA-binding transcriptional regulator AlpA
MDKSQLKKKLGMDLVSKKELLEVIPLSARTIDDAKKYEGLPHYKIGSRVLYDLNEVREWLKERYVVSAG